MLKKTLLIILLMTIQFSMSQETGFDAYRDLKSAPTLQLGSDGKVEVDLTSIKGSPFLNDDFVEGFIYDSKKDTKTELFLRYDVFNDIFEILLGRNMSSIKTLKRSTNFEYILNDEKFVLIQSPSIINKKQYVTGNGYVAEVKNFNNDLALYKRYMKEYRPPVKAETMYDLDKPAVLVNEFFYILKDKNSFTELESHKKRILDGFPKKYQKELNKFIKSNKFKFRGDDDNVEKQIIELIQHYSEIK